VRLDVPFVSQSQSNDCGPAALASVLAFHGRALPLDEVTRRVFTPGLERTLLPDMENYARSQGFATRSGRGDADLIRQSVSGGSPVILMLEVGGRLYSQGHYVVVYGHDPQGFLMHVGTGADRYLSEQDLLERWEPMNRLYLVVE
jgi:ABC-type bacteriocin/lantibiotic exporter with double-glycine peptidase domain